MLYLIVLAYVPSHYDWFVLSNQLFRQLSEVGRWPSTDPVSVWATVHSQPLPSSPHIIRPNRHHKAQSSQHKSYTASGQDMIIVE